MQAKFIKDLQVSDNLFEHIFLVQGTPIFKAGQYQSIESKDGKVFGPYSIFSSPSDLPFVSYLSRHPLSLGTEEIVKITPPSGQMIVGKDITEHPTKRYKFIAGGTGITPFVSIARFHQDQEFQLYWSYKSDTDLALRQYCLDSLSHIKLSLDKFHHDKLESFLKLIEIDPDSTYYIAGPYIFVDIVGTFLLDSGIVHIKSDMKRFV